MGKLEIQNIDIGVTGNFGYPVDKSKRHQWPNYSKDTFIKTGNHDLVLVDGRFRVACTLQCIPNTPDECTIIIHDFWNRPEYHVLLNCLYPECRVDTLCVFSKKNQSLKLDKIHALINQYQYLPGDKVPV